jgi:hypothetical protein
MRSCYSNGSRRSNGHAFSEGVSRATSAADVAHYHGCAWALLDILLRNASGLNTQRVPVALPAGMASRPPDPLQMRLYQDCGTGLWLRGAEPRGQCPWRGVGGSAPDRAPRRRPTSSKLRAPPVQIARCSCLNRIIQESYGDGSETSRPATPSTTTSAASAARQRQISRYIRRPKAASPIAMSATSSLTTSIAP